MRCPNCCKFTGLECGEPEEESIEFTPDESGITIIASVRAIRNCVECGDTMKELTVDFEDTVSWKDITEKAQLTEPELEALIAAVLADDGSAELDVTFDTGESAEGGGGRYAKNMIETSATFAIKLDWKREDETVTKIEHSFTMTNSAAASEYDECC